MKTITALLLTVFSVLLAGSAFATDIVSVTPSASQLPAYDLLEIAIELDTAYTNPYDPAEVTVDIAMTTPAGDETFPAFWFEPYDYELVGGYESFTPAGPGHWLARYAPLAAGEYSFRVVVHDDGGEVVSDDYLFTATAAVSPGFVRVSDRNSRYFAFDDGRSYVPLGFNVDWTRETSGGFAYLDYLDDLAGGGGNWTRLWMTHFNQGFVLEWGAYHWTGYYEGLGRYSQQAGARLDAVLAHAQDVGVYLQIVLHQHSQFETPQWSSWADNPYNAANGGPCATSADYFTNEQALTYARNLHRYMVARYAAYRSVLAWELWNEADLISGVHMDLMTPWSQEMAAQIRALDPAHHLVTTSFGLPLTLPTYDLTTWDYNNRHQYVYGSWMIGLFLGPYRDAGTPLLLGEFGIDYEAIFNARDTLGVNVHNGIWSCLMRGYAGGSMYWWWDDYIAVLDLWSLNQPPGAFLAGEDIARFNSDATVSAAAGRKALEAAGIARQKEDVTSEAWVWVHDRQSDWWGPMEDIAPVENAVVTLSALGGEAGTVWTAEVWDTWAGAATGTIEAEADVDSVTLTLPSFSRDLALKLSSEPPAADDDTVDDDTVDDDASDDDAVDDDTSDDDLADDDLDNDDDAGNDDTADDDLAPSSDSGDDDASCGCGGA